MSNYGNMINTVLDGRYRLMDIIGTGGMAVVFEADDLKEKRRVAVKMLKDEIKEDERELKRFINESRAVAMLSHPNIVQVFDVFVKSSGEHQYIVMELIDGITLKDYISKKGRLNWKEAIGYTEQVLSALGHAHEKGIIHRDVKPQNIMLLRSGSLKITDFGIAKIPNSEQLTLTDKAIGTVHYVSPEQASGKGNVTTVSDIYSVGIMLYEMTAGKLPFDGNTPIQIAMMHIKDDPLDPRAVNPEMPKGLSQIILKAINKSAYDRYKTAGEMIKQLNIIKANPAAVFDYSNNNNNNGSNLPVEIDKEQNKGALQVAGNTELEPAEPEDIEFDEGKVRKKSRKSKKPLRRRGSRSMLPIISGIFIAFVVVAGMTLMNLLSFFAESGIEDAEVTIPDYIRANFEEFVRDDLANHRLTVGTIEYVNHDSYEENEVIHHLPEPREVKRWTGRDIPVNFTISRGRNSYVIRDFAVEEYRSVGFELERWWIIYERILESDDTIPRNYIIRTEPGPGTTLRSGDEIKIYVSSGQDVKRVLMPDVVGETSEEAQRILTREGIGITRINSEYSDVYAPGYITEQDIIPGRRVLSKSTKVTLWVSLGSRPPDPTEEGEAPEEPPEESDGGSES